MGFKARGTPACWLDCSICSKLPVADMVTYPWDGSEPEGAFAPETARLEQLERDTRRCPQCNTYYVLERESDHDHYIANNSYETLRRMAPAEAFDRVGDAERPRLAEVYPRQMAAIAAALAADLGTRAQRIELAKALAWASYRAGDMDELVGWLRHPDDNVRKGAVAAMNVVCRSGSFRPELLDALVERLDEEDTLYDAGSALHSQCFKPTFRPALPALVDRLDHANAWTRGTAAMLIDVHVRKAGPLEVAADLRERIPVLKRHVASPKTAKTFFGGTAPSTKPAATMLLVAIERPS